MVVASPFPTFPPPTGIRPFSLWVPLSSLDPSRASERGVAALFVRAPAQLDRSYVVMIQFLTFLSPWLLALFDLATPVP